MLSTNYLGSWGIEQERKLLKVKDLEAGIPGIWILAQ